MIPKILKVSISVIVFMVAAGMLYIILSHKTKPPEIVKIYHQSQFFKYAPLVESSIKETSSNAKIELDRVMGGIVPHHLPATISLLVEFYTKLKNTRNVKTFIILGPDHMDRGKGDISVSRAHFITPFGILETDENIINHLEKYGFIINDETPFEQEISIDAQLLLISKIFPEAKIVPLIFRSNISNEKARIFGKLLASVCDHNTFIISSVDFSHYLPEKQARPLDYLSGSVLSAMNSKLTALVDADSIQSLTTFIAFLEAKGANFHTDLHIFNTSDFNNNIDYTTGYVTGFWGNK